ncbi:MAG: hypothetical protein K8R90_03695 [Candidatus Cloacimonetes bacterium]|nr:hypothetical protein [Candidatus Cloacimonadota bacterium]
MKKRLEMEFKECLSCPFCRLTKNIEDPRGDIWKCYYDAFGSREIIEDKALHMFREQYSQRFPSWCPLPEIADDAAKPQEDDTKGDDSKFKWTLKDPTHCDLKRAVIYLADDGKTWRLFATRSSTGRTTDSSYEDYSSLEDVLARFEQDHGLGNEWLREPIRESRRIKG